MLLPFKSSFWRTLFSESVDWGRACWKLECRHLHELNQLAGEEVRNSHPCRESRLCQKRAWRVKHWSSTPPSIGHFNVHPMKHVVAEHEKYDWNRVLGDRYVVSTCSHIHPQHSPNNPDISVKPSSATEPRPPKQAPWRQSALGPETTGGSLLRHGYVGQAISS